MKKFQIIPLIAAFSLAVTMLASCASTDGSVDGDEIKTGIVGIEIPDIYDSEVIMTVENKILDDFKPISIENNLHADKVITAPTFDIADSLSDGGDYFTISPLFNDYMVLQANMPVRIWGECTLPGGVAVRVVNDETNAAQTFYGNVNDGKFELYIGKFSYGGPYTISVIASDSGSIEFYDVLFGEVFISGGQSNQGWGMSQCYDGNIDTLLYQDIIDDADYENVRMSLVWPMQSDEPFDELASGSMSKWGSLDSNRARNTPAAAFFFATRLYNHYKIPIGIITSCMGGTGIYAWYPQQDSAERGFNSDLSPSVWYNAMINPIRKLTARGVIWYQGEGHHDGYADLLNGMIGAWRREFDNETMYFSVVQLPRFMEEAPWFLCREEDKKVSEITDNVTYSVNIDAGLYPENTAEGDPLNDSGIHPYDKKPVGERLADATAAHFFGAGGVLRGPVIKSAKAINDGVQLTFDNIGNGLILIGEAGFEIAGEDGIFKDVKPELYGANTIFLRTDIHVVQVRYGQKNYSDFITKPVTSCAQSVCVYNTKEADDAIGYPLEQFLVSDIRLSH